MAPCQPPGTKPQPKHQPGLLLLLPWLTPADAGSLFCKALPLLLDKLAQTCGSPDLQEAGCPKWVTGTGLGNRSCRLQNCPMPASQLPLRRLLPCSLSSAPCLQKGVTTIMLISQGWREAQCDHMCEVLGREPGPREQGRNSSQGHCRICENVEPLFKRQKKPFSLLHPSLLLLSVSISHSALHLLCMTGSPRQRMVTGQVGGEQRR